MSSGDITYVANTHLSILEHHEPLPMFVTKLRHYPIVLGIPWLELHDVAIRFSSCTLTFGSQYCATHFNRIPTVVHTDSLASKVAPQEPAVSAGAGEFVARAFTSPKSFFQNQADHGKDYNVGLGARSLNWRARWNENGAAPETSFFDKNAAVPETRASLTTQRPSQISAIGGHPFR